MLTYFGYISSDICGSAEVKMFCTHCIFPMYDLFYIPVASDVWPYSYYTLFTRVLNEYMSREIEIPWDIVMG